MGSIAWTLPPRPSCTFAPFTPRPRSSSRSSIERIAQRIGRRLERLGYLTRDSAEGQDPHLTFPNDAEPPEDQAPSSPAHTASHCMLGVACSPAEPDLLRRLTRYIARPALAESRLSLTPQGDLRYRIKSPWRDGTTHLILHPLDFLARLASLVPKPRVNLTRYHGILAPHARERSLIPPPAGALPARVPQSAHSPPPSPARG